MVRVVPTSTPRQPAPSGESPTPRRALRGVPEYVPGKRLPAREGAITYKISANENPYPPLPGVIAAATESMSRVNRYPDTSCADLIGSLSTRLGVTSAEVVLGTGSVALIYQIVQAFCEPGDEVVYAWRSFEAYPIAVSVGGATGVPVPLADGARHDLTAMAMAITGRTKVVLLCTPNNPTGPAITRTELDDFLTRVPAHVLVVIDEAYVEFVRHPDPVASVPLVGRHPNVVVTRTFSKVYGLAGLRVGYAVAPSPVAAALRTVSLPFGITEAAQAAAVASLSAESELAARVRALADERDRVIAGLHALGWKVPEAQGNFVWLRLGDRAAAFAEAAATRGIVVRPFVGDGCRVTVAEPEANDIFLDVVRDFHPS
jgi:histidinol-phosphate aminotransferase